MGGVRYYAFLVRLRWQTRWIYKSYLFTPYSLQNLTQYNLMPMYRSLLFVALLWRGRKWTNKTFRQLKTWLVFKRGQITINDRFVSIDNLLIVTLSLILIKHHRSAHENRLVNMRSTQHMRVVLATRMTMSDGQVMYYWEINLISHILHNSSRENNSKKAGNSVCLGHSAEI